MFDTVESIFGSVSTAADLLMGATAGAASKPKTGGKGQPKPAAPQLAKPGAPGTGLTPPAPESPATGKRVWLWVGAGVGALLLAGVIWWALKGDA